MTPRQQAINALYKAYREAGDDDMNARLRIQRDADEIIALPLDHATTLVDLEAYLENATPVTDAELDSAEMQYEAEVKQ